MQSIFENILLSRKLFAIIILLFSSCNSFAEEPPMDWVEKVTLSLFRQNNGRVLCMPQSASKELVRAALDPQLKGIDTNNQSSINAIANAVYTTFPCPFSPFRSELRVATKADVVGDWLFPETSQKFRFGPKSPAWKAKPGLPPVKCESISYLSSGDMLTVQILGANACPTSSDMTNFFNKSPHVEGWSLMSDGRLKIIRTDIVDHIEEWDVFFVEKSFVFFETAFNKGDLVAYLRREKGNDFNASTTFRHLTKL
jgi:hypothetical protein